MHASEGHNSESHHEMESSKRLRAFRWADQDGPEQQLNSDEQKGDSREPQTDRMGKLDRNRFHREPGMYECDRQNHNAQRPMPNAMCDLRRTRRFTLHRPSDIWTTNIAATIQAVLAAPVARSIVGCVRESPSASLPTQSALGT